MKKQIIVISSPSGGGKTTLARHLRKIRPDIEFSISATTRNMRPGEYYAKDYYFLLRKEFEEKIKNNDFIEYEEIYGNYYGTLKSEIEEKINQGKILLFDVDVKGALNLKKHYEDKALLIFIAPPDIETLRKRLSRRNTENEETLKLRIERAEMELQQKDKFDEIIINDDLKSAFEKLESIADEYI